MYLFIPIHYSFIWCVFWTQKIRFMQYLLGFLSYLAQFYVPERYTYLLPKNYSSFTLSTVWYFIIWRCQTLFVYSTRAGHIVALSSDYYRYWWCDYSSVGPLIKMRHTVALCVCNLEYNWWVIGNSHVQFISISQQFSKAMISICMPRSHVIEYQYVLVLWPVESFFQ